MPTLARSAGELFRHVAAEKAALYRAIMDTFAAARRQFRLRWAVAPRDGYVCENRNLVAIAAGAPGPHCAPLVCTDGMPAASQRAVLSQMVCAGARLRYHGDFDWPGSAIANAVVETFGAVPRRFGTNDYRAALENNADTTRALAGAVVAARLDGALAQAMQAHGRAVDEEALADILLPDLDRRSKPSCLRPSGLAAFPRS